MVRSSPTSRNTLPSRPMAPCIPSRYAKMRPSTTVPPSPPPTSYSPYLSRRIPTSRALDVRIGRASRSRAPTIARSCSRSPMRMRRSWKTLRSVSCPSTCGILSRPTSSLSMRSTRTPSAPARSRSTRPRPMLQAPPPASISHRSLTSRSANRISHVSHSRSSRPTTRCSRPTRRIRSMPSRASLPTTSSRSRSRHTWSRHRCLACSASSSTRTRTRPLPISPPAPRSRRLSIARPS